MIYDSNYYVGSDLNGDSLSHHGVPHQKWGVKNGPPYPIQRGREVKYNVGKMTPQTKASLAKAGKIAVSSAQAASKTVENAAKTVVKKASSSFQKWKENKKADLATMDTNSKLVKNWQKKQLRISDMSNQELQQRIDRKKLEETYKHALRGDFSDPKTWNAKAGKGSDKGKKASDSILSRVGNAAIEGLTKGLANKIEQTMTAKAKAKVARKEARRNAIEEVMTEAAKERAKYKADNRNQAWKERQEQKRERNERNRYNDGAMDPTMGWKRRPRSYGALGGSSGKPTGSYYYAGPNEWTVS